MMKRFIFDCIFLLSISYSYSQTVYVCSGSKTSKYYINKECRGLKSCGSPGKATTVAAMTAHGRSACKICIDEVSAATTNRTTNNAKQSHSLI